jgi:penicillin-binding protein 2
MDPRNGDVLALASSPGYDPNDFVPAMPEAVWNRLMDDPAKPMLHRAVAGAYAPGSVFKPVIAFAALEHGKIDAGTRFTCPGHFELGDTRFACWYHHGHGPQQVREALRNSCNVFFFQTGLLCGREMIARTASALGFGEPTGIDLDYEAAGRIPLGRQERGWYGGDTCNLSIGQGPVTVTPLQIAVMACAIANGGRVPWPRLVLGIRPPGREGFDPIPPRMVNEMNWSPASLDLVRDGLHDVVMHRSGTGRLARLPGLDAAGKTGTAEFGPKGHDKKRAWMMAYAPATNPRYAVALVLDEGQGGGVDAAPRVRLVLSRLFGLPLPESEADHG